MLSKLKFLLFISVFCIGTSSVRAQSNDYLRHRKIFDLCSFKRECSNCYECGKQRYIVKINNKETKAIKKISYSFYSDVYNKILTKEATIKGDRIDPKQIGIFHICVPMGDHWAITEIVYADESAYKFIVRERMENFLQEPDECDCND